jgi:YD repeat-containing protein
LEFPQAVAGWRAIANTDRSRYSSIMEQQPANSDSPDGRNEAEALYIYDYRNRPCRQPADSTAAGGAAHGDADGRMVTYTYDAGGNLISQTSMTRRPQKQPPAPIAAAPD